MSIAAPATPRRIAIVGVGNIGSKFAFQLARIGGHDVTVVARPDSNRLEQLRRDGAIVDVKGTQASVHVADVLDEQAPFDLVIVTLLAHQVDAVLPALRRSAAKCIQFMFNTLHPERLREAVGPERCAFGMDFVQATLDGDGRFKATVGAGGQKTLMDEERWADLFKASGLPATVERDMPSWLRCHVPLCVACESVSVTGVRRGGGASWKEVLALACGVHASFGLIKALGYPVYPRTKALIDRAPASMFAAVLWSMSRVRVFRELLATGQAEFEALIDAMIAAAPQAEDSVRVTDIAAMKPS
ncbi:NAD(P)-binding domain-containing protein [Lichenihabitans sp. PAMC28606]|uniref:ketopantoate reductase family protein n=1 Tax=Lichenihabitans sp. PAMC28606 TaxID=2880932 RepID=UPI001D09D753|nr:2-dehydropantoate 2-reductase N-terminal domain-containing protein [Lichenihabitans sp. PAMC28606]UDL96252.1 NAD(P)-binding domain-containing protein [Lichenihabitans sp. PAMC28606]